MPAIVDIQMLEAELARNESRSRREPHREIAARSRLKRRSRSIGGLLRAVTRYAPFTSIATNTCIIAPLRNSSRGGRPPPANDNPSRCNDSRSSRGAQAATALGMRSERVEGVGGLRVEYGRNFAERFVEL